jgi:putative cell wall-binding protein
MRVRAAAALAALLLPLVVAAPAAAVTETDDTVGIVKEGVAPTNAEIAVRLSEQTPLPDTSTVLIARDDRFADALASGVLQRTSPLLLVPTTGPIPPRVVGEIARLQATRAIVLGGEQAVAPDVVDQLRALGLEVERREGDTRLRTAVDIAATDAPEATTAFLARAFASEGSADETQAFADTLALGAFSAETSWPVLLTETAALSPQTRDHLVSSEVRTVKIVGGEAAVSRQVEDELRTLGFEVERISGADRFSTAIEIAKSRGADSAAEVGSVIVLDSQFADAWAGGLAAAASGALTGSPIVLTSGPVVPEVTRSFLSTGTDGTSERPITCVAFPDACEQARVAVGLIPAADVMTDTPDGSVVVPGQQVTVTVDGEGRPVSDVRAEGDCLGAPVEDGTSPAITVVLADPLPPVSCTLRVEFTVGEVGGFAQLDDGLLRQAEVLTYTTVDPNPSGGLSVVESGPQLDARQLASNLVGEDVQVFGATLTGGAAGAGVFTGGQGPLGVEQGVVLSTGLIADVVGPNDLTDTSGFLGAPGAADLTALAGGETFDATILEFEFVAAPDATRVAFEYLFGSEEYPEFVDQGFNDVFAFYVNDQNCAVVGGQAVSVDTVNAQRNAESFRANDPDGSGTSPIDVELDGLTVPLRCEAPITPGAANRLRLAIADTGDEIYDSAVFIRAASFSVS